MDSSKKIALIKEAQLHLVQNPQDLAHEVTHHYRVWLLAKELGENIQEDFDPDILEVICWWHDVDTGIVENDKRVAEVTAVYVSEKFDRTTKDIVFDSILNHEFGLEPHYLEGKILQDADKLEILSTERMRILQNAVESGLYDKSKFYKVVKNILENWLPIMPEKYNFDYSREKHNEMLLKIQSVLDTLKAEIS